MARQARAHPVRRIFIGSLTLLLTGVTGVTAATAVTAVSPPTPARAAPPWWSTFEVQSLDGGGNNRANPAWGRVGTSYSRVAPARYADGRSAPVSGPNSRMVSNRIFNDRNQNVFSEGSVTQWGFVWGQFLDHTFGLRDETGPAQNIAFNPADPLESFTNTLGVVPFSRSGATPGTGDTNARQQPNTVSSFIDAWPVYGGTQARLEWLREGPVDGNMSNNSARLMLPSGLLPRRDARGDAASAPRMDVNGRLLAQPARAVVAGDVRANENIGLQATQTLFALEHNRIVSLLPNTLTEEEKFQIARRVVIAEEQYITYHEFLPALGVTLPAYPGYQPNVDATLSNEFAVVGYRAHSMIHGEVELETEAARYSPQTLAALEEQGVEIAVDGADIEMAVPLNVGFFNPDLVGQLQLGPLLQGIGLEAQYNNDEQIDNQLRSVLFQVPVSGNPECLDGPGLPECFSGVIDLGAIDIERGRDHGMPSYNQLRQAYGLPAKASFTAITGEASDSFPADPELTAGNEINDPDSLDFVGLNDRAGGTVELDSPDAEALPIRGHRRTPLAARLRAIYGSVNNVDAFVGMLAEAHLPGREMGELQTAIWARQFQALRDGDRFFYANDASLTNIRNDFGIDFRRSLAQVIASNTDIPLSDLHANVFLASAPEPATCRAEFLLDSQWPGGMQARVRLTNLGTTAINGWTARWLFTSGQRAYQWWSANLSAPADMVTVTNAAWNGGIAPGASVEMGFLATWDNAVNAKPAGFTLNDIPCEVD